METLLTFCTGTADNGGSIQIIRQDGDLAIELNHWVYGAGGSTTFINLESPEDLLNFGQDITKLAQKLIKEAE